ncbi:MULTISPECIES: acetyl-CoA carboxylase biotin carboxyl carrier protein [unclassified Granulicatella]|uniref:acetyl-CoA carboxylase biotin carboxyl carrier protein n=1 Tax=unclassified Granulicatella TaxID=2630493 RepID=UPI001073D402|nr:MULTISPECIES: acetyl-CoA carboxylase biotin carboxyl carrier protein [unclassified Granulicatella]MBF0780894.1 acetyl-CoA carboxylase biotin carboxyl carrier protein [Granulicatella sp. 19428wC4_WM01]TFU93245.1 acetyl-CoA carboxylase biotin carboxyl carrier protein [Granulicatella sp. WM01]
MTIDNLHELMTLINQTDFQFVDLQMENIKLTISKRKVPDYMPIADNNNLKNENHIVESTDMYVQEVNDTLSHVETKHEENKDLVDIVSPLVGIAYLSPSPKAEPFVKVGDYIQKGQVVCIIEAMKIMNEIKSDSEGIVEKILIDNESVVEYSQVLFKVKERR